MSRRRKAPLRRRKDSLSLRPIRVPVYLDKRTFKALRNKALDTGISVTAAVEGLIKEWVKARRKGSTPKG